MYVCMYVYVSVCMYMYIYMAVGRLAALGAKLEARNAFKQTPLHLAGAPAEKTNAYCFFQRMS